ncbi:WbqC family protein [Streptomyces pactum]|uniref:WbqC family protein n=1 Tax=Streptomyces pactum TaxID=68249 RepID=A0ABS0NFR8_9ACTN|nr:WbqC family protein [Streptomyces pactum]MBH5334016.1 WbqC family protein [Streptomyces pactum]
MPHTSPSSATASPAASSPDQPTYGELCAIHQPNLFPRLTTLGKLFAADTRIDLDDVQFTRRDYQHRTRLAALEDPHQTRWLSIPTHLPHGRQTAIRDALIADPTKARRRTEAVIRQEYRASPHWPALQQALEPVWAAFDTGRTAAVAETSTRILLDILGWTGRVLTASDLPARSDRSERLAHLTTAAGATTYLCGSGGMTYLDPIPFTARNIAVAPFLPPTTGIWASARHVTSLWALAHLGPAGLTARLRALKAAFEAGSRNARGQILEETWASEPPRSLLAAVKQDTQVA